MRGAAGARLCVVPPTTATLPAELTETGVPPTLVATPGASVTPGAAGPPAAPGAAGATKADCCVPVITLPPTVICGAAIGTGAFGAPACP